MDCPDFRSYQSEREKETADDEFLETFVSGSKLVCAVQRDDLPELVRCVESGTPINSVDYLGNTCLHTAVKLVNIKILHYILQQPDVNINCLNRSKLTPLLLSLHRSRKECAIKLINAGAGCNIADSDLITPLHLAVRNKFHDIARLLIENGADVDAIDTEHSFTPLHHAVLNSDLEMVGMLIYYRADANIPSKSGSTPFMIGLRHRTDIDIQALLLEYETDLNRVTSYCNLENVPYTCHRRPGVRLRYLMGRIQLYGTSTLQIAVKGESPLLPDLISRGAKDDDAFVFKKICEQFDNKRMSKFRDSPIVALLHDVDKLSVNWLECLRAVFYSQNFADLFRIYPDEQVYFVENLIAQFWARNLPESELYTFLCIYLTQLPDATIYANNIRRAYYCYGYGEIVELFLQMDVHPSEEQYFSVVDLVCQIKPTRRNYYWTDEHIVSFNECLQFCIPSQEMKQNFYNARSALTIKPHLTYAYEEAENRLKILDVPSLLEISREAARRVISLRYDTRNTCQFYTILKWLRLPQRVKDIISYKVAVYKFD